MKNISKTKQELIEGIDTLKQRVKELEQSEIIHKGEEEILRESAERFRSLVETTTSDWIWELDNDGCFTYVSSKIKDLSGYEPDAVIGKAVFDLMAKDKAERTTALFREIMSYRQPFTGLESAIIDKNGREITVEISGVPIVDVLGNYQGYRGFTRDITGRKRSEEALHASGLQLSQAMDLANIVYWELNPANNMFVFNDPFYALYGTTAEQEGGYRMTREEYAERFIHPDDRMYVSQTVEQNVVRAPRESPYDLEHRIIRRDGEVRNIVIRATAAKDDSGRLIKRYGVNQDITERKQAERELRINEEKFRKVFYTSPNAISINRLNDGICISINTIFSDITGYSEEEVIGKTSDDLNIWCDPNDKALLMEGIKNKGKVENLELQFRTKTGETRYGLISATLIDFDGVPHLLNIMHDMTQQKRAEEEKARLESQLSQAQKTEAIGTLTGGIAHDFNNILTALTGYTTLLQMKMDIDDPLRIYVNQVLSASEKATELVKSLLVFSRQQAIRLNPVSLNSIIKGTEKLLKRLLTEDIIINTLLAPEDIAIMADATQIDQILFNLTANARDAMPHGGTLTIETKLVELDDMFRYFHGYGERGIYALLSISDTGIGMDETTRGRIFDPFFTTKELGRGTGLGLSTVYGIVKQHKGYINTYSEPGIGTTFHIYLPVSDTVDNEERSIPVPIRGGNETILVAEDDDTVRDLVRTMLADYGYSVIEAIDGEDAINRFTEAGGKIDLVILDTVMPKKNGRQVYDEIIRIKPDSKVLFTSGYTRDIVLDKGMEDEKFEFIQKPVSPYELLKKVRQMLDDVSGS